MSFLESSIKERLLDIEATLSQAAAWISPPNDQRALCLAQISQCRKEIIQLCEEIENSEKN